MASIGLETYRVVQDFTAREGDYVIVVNGLCVGVDGSGHLKGAAIVTPKKHVAPTPVNYTQRNTEIVDAMAFIRTLAPTATFTAHELGVMMGLVSGRHVGISEAIRRMVMAGEVQKVPNARSHGPYVRVSSVNGAT